MTRELKKGFRRTLEWVAVMTVLTVMILGAIYSASRPTIIVNGNPKQAEQYLESHTFRNISMTEFYTQVFGNHSFYIDSNLRIGDFQLGLTEDYKVRAMVMDIIDTANPVQKRYSVEYNRDSGYFKVLEFSQKDNERFDPTAGSFLSKLDEYKDRIEFPRGNYSYYEVGLQSSGTLSGGKNVYVITDQGARQALSNSAAGFNLMVYAEPIGKADMPTFYIMPYGMVSQN